MRHADPIAARFEVVAGAFGKRDASVLASGASDGDSELLLALFHIAGHNHVEKLAPTLQKLDGLVPIHHEIAHGGIKAGQRTKRRIVIGIREESARR